jgi:hypothetical protein
MFGCDFILALLADLTNGAKYKDTFSGVSFTGDDDELFELMESVDP